MPRTKGGKKDERTHLEKLEGYKDSKIDLFIFFGYYDGLVSEGVCGWVVNDSNRRVGCRHHQKGNLCDKVLTTSQFRSKARKIYLIAEGLAGLGENLDLASYRPHFTNEDFAKFEAERRKKEDAGDPMTKLLTVKDEKALFIFFQYYDGIKTKGKEGFSLNVANFGSVAHLGIYPGYFKERGENWFRRVSKVMGKLAERFVADGIAPPETMRPRRPTIAPATDMLHAFRNSNVNHELYSVE
ncbi:unnamed protein product [Cylindrotheca closterium]|uniref:Uncharacterized protein n=1 Tax=Cylindrotheca closterium TaxID=2856 RepID=A0AAD2FXQ7_9STRA|nr:unnamed protein product [Cylindrotheca closterium]